MRQDVARDKWKERIIWVLFTRLLASTSSLVEPHKVAGIAAALANRNSLWSFPSWLECLLEPKPASELT